MDYRNIINAEIKDDGRIVHTLAEIDGSTLHPKAEYSRVLAGLSWPTENAPWCYCILGEERRVLNRFDGHQEPGKLRFLAERVGQRPFLDECIMALSDDCSNYGCRSVFADLRGDNEDISNYFRDWMSCQETLVLGLQQAPFCDNPTLGLSIIKSKLDDRLIELPEGSVARQQLRGVVAGDLAELGEKDFYAVNALRHVLAIIHKRRFVGLAGRWTPRRN